MILHLEKDIVVDYRKEKQKFKTLQLEKVHRSIDHNVKKPYFQSDRMHDALFGEGSDPPYVLIPILAISLKKFLHPPSLTNIFYAVCQSYSLEKSLGKCLHSSRRALPPFYVIPLENIILRSLLMQIFRTADPP